MLIVLGRSDGLPIFLSGGDFLDLSYRIIRSSRKTLALEIQPDGRLLVRAPRRMSEKAIREFVLSKESWISDKLRKFQDRPVLPPLSGQELDTLKQRAREYLPGRAALYAPRAGVSYASVTIRCQRTRWGSCSSRGNLSFNCLLMLMPSQIRDYVVVHELCHRKHMNHSAAFWAEVARVCPDYLVCRQWLKDNGSVFLSRLPD